ncbi:hypothetical protein [Endozoicomonas sp. 4G]|uniref:hypothetical protein n=1 Tax=Endozoicomonas sp. 4G TaxID=2872754 RepID=UPI002078CE9B|nr:hypothetical protein [Endozoicomonas sp. 4G]
MDFNSEKEQLITQLIRETIANNLTWAVKPPPYSLKQATENYVPLYIEGEYRNTRIGIYEIRQKYFTDIDEYHWTENLGICIVQDPEIVVWQVEEYSPALKELFNMARHQASGIRGILGM